MSRNVKAVENNTKYLILLIQELDNDGNPTGTPWCEVYDPSGKYMGEFRSEKEALDFVELQKKNDSRCRPKI